jgi:hypothetical protein
VKERQDAKFAAEINRLKVANQKQLHTEMAAQKSAAERQKAKELADKKLQADIAKMQKDVAAIQKIEAEKQKAELDKKLKEWEKDPSNPNAPVDPRVQEQIDALRKEQEEANRIA